MAFKTRKRFVGLGEGRSKPIYLEPTVHDTAVLIAFYNPARYKRILKNALYVISVLKEKNIPFFVAECVFHKYKSQIPNATLVLQSDSYMFYKEQLLNKLVPHVPKKYTKLIFLDADIIFDAPDWIDTTSAALDKFDIMQPFSESCWLTPDNTRIRSKKSSYAFAIVTKKDITNKTIHDYHPGFAWAMKRDIFLKIGGFFEKSIIGGGDVAFVLNLFPFHVTDELFFNAIHSGFGKYIIDAWRQYNDAFKKVNPTLGYLTNKALHLFHGVKENRQYVSRYRSIGTAIKGTWEDEVTTNSDGLFEFKRPEMNSILLSYFKGRNEDISIEEADQIIKDGGKKRVSTTRKGGRITIKSTVDDGTIVTLPSQ